MSKYVFRQGSRVSGVDAQTAGDELERIREEHGKLESRVVVEEARPTGAPLHPAFTWNNEKAADNWRLHEARHLIRSVRVIKDSDDEPRTKYVHVRNEDDRGGAYHDVETVVQDVDLFHRALTQLRQQMHSAARAVQDLERAAKESGDRDKMDRVAIAVRAIEAANSAVKALH